MRSSRWSALLFLVAACGTGGRSSRYISVASTAPSHSLAAEPPSPEGNTSVHHGVNPWVDVTKDNLSTFAADVRCSRTTRDGSSPMPEGSRIQMHIARTFVEADPAVPQFEGGLAKLRRRNTRDE